MAFPYVFGRPTGRVGYQVRTVHRAGHGGESALWTYDLLRSVATHPEQFRACGICGPVMFDVVAAAATALVERRA